MKGRDGSQAWEKGESDGKCEMEGIWKDEG